MFKIDRPSIPTEEIETAGPSGPALQPVTAENLDQIKVTGERAYRHAFWLRYKTQLSLALLLAVATAAVITGYLAGVNRTDNQLSSLLSAEQSTDEKLLSLNQRFEAERAELLTEIDQLEQAVASAPSAQELRLQSDELAQAKAELDEVSTSFEAEVLELQRSNAGLRASNEEVTAQRQQALQDAAQARALESEAKASLSSELARIPTRLAALTLPSGQAQYRLQGQNSVVRESFGLHFGSWNDSIHSGDVGGFADYGLEKGPVSAEWIVVGESLRIEVGLPQLKTVGLNNFSADSIQDNSGWIARLFNSGDSAEVVMHLEQQVLRPRACSDTASLRDYVNLIEAEFATQAKPYRVEVLWRGSEGMMLDQPDDSMLLGSAC